MDKTLHVYADEIGDIGPFDERSPIYALSLIFVDEATDRSKGLSALKREETRFGLGRFIHSGNLIRGEKPYEGKLREERQRLFWALLTYAAGIDFRVAASACRSCFVRFQRLFSLQITSVHLSFLPCANPL